MDTKNIISVYTDGGSRGNPGKGATGVVIYQDIKVVGELSKYLGIVTNNEAEYEAVIEALGWLETHPEIIAKSSSIHFFLDSLLVCSQLKGLYKVKNERLQLLCIKAKQIEAKIDLKIAYQHIPREKNKAADKLVNQTLDKHF